MVWDYTGILPIFKSVLSSLHHSMFMVVTLKFTQVILFKGETKEILKSQY